MTLALNSFPQHTGPSCSHTPSTGGHTLGCPAASILQNMDIILRQYCILRSCNDVAYQLLLIPARGEWNSCLWALLVEVVLAWLVWEMRELVCSEENRLLLRYTKIRCSYIQAQFCPHITNAYPQKPLCSMFFSTHSKIFGGAFVNQTESNSSKLEQTTNSVQVDIT
jgi:hypothetical protein